MTITVASTTKIVTMNGIECRIWEGKTAKGTPMHCYIARVAVDLDADPAEFENDLTEHQPPSAAVFAIPLSMIL